MTFKNVILYIAKALVMIVAVLLLMVWTSSKDSKGKIYPQVTVINTEYRDVLDSLGIGEIEYYEWEETAFALNCEPKDLPVHVFIEHLLGDPEYYHKHAY